MRTELVSLIHQNKVIFISIPIIIIVFIKNFVQTAIGNEFCILVYTEVFEGCFPILLYSRRINHKNLGVVTPILLQEFLSNHGRNDSFSQTHNVGKKETVVAQQLLIALYYCIHLVVIFGVVFWNVKRIFVISIHHTIRKILHEHLDIEIIRKYVAFEISSLYIGFEVFGCYLASICLFPKFFKLIFRKLYIIILRHLHIELILFILCDSQPIARKVTGTSNNHSLRVLVEIIRIQHIYLGMNFL